MAIDLANLATQVYQVLDAIANPPPIDINAVITYTLSRRRPKPRQRRKPRSPTGIKRRPIDAFWIKHAGFLQFCIEEKLVELVPCEMQAEMQPGAMELEITELGKQALEAWHKPAQDRLVFDLEKKTITFDGKVYDAPEMPIRWVRVLADRPGEWIASNALRKFDPDLIAPRTSRWLKQLPKPIAKLIQSQPGAGSRLCL
jgi:hypothetical protein